MDRAAVLEVQTKVTARRARSLTDEALVARGVDELVLQARRHRLSLGQSLTVFAKKLGLHPQHLGDLERGRRALSSMTRELLALALALESS